MPSIDVSDLDRLLASWDKLLKEFPGSKRDVLERMGQRLLAQVKKEIGGTGTVQGWQERYVGSKNGYVAVRPKAKTYKTTAGGKKYAVGYVTNAIEGGHKHRKPSQVKKDGYKYRARIHVAAVPGKHFYAAVRARPESVVQDELKQLAAEVAQGLEGTL